MIPLPPNILIGGAAATLLAGLGAGWAAHGVWTDANQFRALERADKREDAARAQGLEQGKVYADLSASLAGARGTDRTTIERIYQNAPPVPVDCAAPAGVVRVLENGVRRANAAAAGEPVPTLPRSAPTTDPAAGPSQGPVGG